MMILDENQYLNEVQMNQLVFILQAWRTGSATNSNLHKIQALTKYYTEPLFSLQKPMARSCRSGSEHSGSMKN